MRIALAVLFFVHALAHLPGFVVPWRLATLEEMPYKTTLLDGRLDVGDAGIRLVGLLWLVAALAFVAAGVGLLLGAAWWGPLSWASVVLSLILSALGWPEARLGLALNVVIVALLLGGERLGWWPKEGS